MVGTEEPKDRRAPESVDLPLKEAAFWFTRMCGDNAEQFRAEFMTWLKGGEERVAAYHRAGEVFALRRFIAHHSSEVGRG